MARAQAKRLVGVCAGLDEAMLQVVKALLGVGVGVGASTTNTCVTGASASDPAHPVPRETSSETKGPTKEAWLDSVMVESARYSESRAATYRFTCSRKVVALQNV